MQTVTVCESDRPEVYYIACDDEPWIGPFTLAESLRLADALILRHISVVTHGPFVETRHANPD